MLLAWQTMLSASAAYARSITRPTFWTDVMSDVISSEFRSWKRVTGRTGATSTSTEFFVCKCDRRRELTAPTAWDDWSEIYYGV
jgi:hypothetical protein